MSFCVTEAVRSVVILGIAMSILLGAAALDLTEQLFGDPPKPADDWL
jgi:hypothetical protein